MIEYTDADVHKGSLAAFTLQTRYEAHPQPDVMISSGEAHKLLAFIHHTFERAGRAEAALAEIAELREARGQRSTTVEVELTESAADRAEIRRLRRMVEAYEASMERETARRRKAENGLVSARSDLSTLRAEAVTRQQEKDDLLRRLEQTDLDNQYLKAEIEGLRTNIGAQMRSIDVANKSVAVLAEGIGKIKLESLMKDAEIAQLREQLASLTEVPGSEADK